MNYASKGKAVRSSAKQEIKSGWESLEREESRESEEEIDTLGPQEQTSGKACTTEVSNTSAGTKYRVNKNKPKE